MSKPYDSMADGVDRSSSVRERGHQVTRLEAFVDAAFAFAVTLLVISVSVPDSSQSLIGAFKGLPAFAASFAQITQFWLVHNTWSRRYGLDDNTTIRLSLLLVFLVLVYVYPMRVVFEVFFTYVSGGWLPTRWQFADRDNIASELSTLFTTFASMSISVGLVLVALYVHAWRQREVLELSNHERMVTREHIASWSTYVATAVVSLLLALSLHRFERGIAYGSPGFVLFTLFFTQPLARRWVRSRERV